MKHFQICHTQMSTFHFAWLEGSQPDKQARQQREPGRGKRSVSHPSHLVDLHHLSGGRGVHVAGSLHRLHGPERLPEIKGQNTWYHVNSCTYCQQFRHEHARVLRASKRQKRVGCWRSDEVARIPLARDYHSSQNLRRRLAGVAKVESAWLPRANGWIIERRRHRPCITSGISTQGIAWRSRRCRHN